MKKLGTVIVVDTNLQFLSTTSPARARKVIKKGRARIYQYRPFIIKLKESHLKIIFNGDPLYVPQEAIYSNVSAKREFNFSFTSLADTLKHARSYFDGGRDKELDEFINDVIATAKEELYSKGEKLGADALCDVNFNVQIEQLKADIVVTVVYQAVTVVKK